MKNNILSTLISIIIFFTVYIFFYFIFYYNIIVKPAIISEATFKGISKIIPPLVAISLWGYYKLLSMKFINLFNVKNKIDTKTNLIEPLEIKSPKSLDIEEKTQTKSASKKIVAREILILISIIIFATAEYNINRMILEPYLDKYMSLYNEKNELKELLKKETYNKRIYKFLQSNNESLPNYFEDFTNRFDSSATYQKEIYKKVVKLDESFQFDIPLDLFITRMNPKLITHNDKIMTRMAAYSLLSSLEKQYEYNYKNYLTSSDNKLFLTLCILIIIYPARLLYYLIRWCVNVIKN